MQSHSRNFICKKFLPPHFVSNSRNFLVTVAMCMCGVHTCVVCLVHICTCVVSTTRLLSHSAQVKETRRSLYDSESGVKKMAVGHQLGERSHTIERSHNLLSGERVEKQDFVNLEEGT